MRVNSSIEINFDTGVSEETFESKLLFAVNRAKGMPSPYVGNKRKLLFRLLSILREEGIQYNSVLDLFSGSACVSIVMKLMGKQVYSNDILKSSCMYAKAFVENNTEMLTAEQKDFLLNHSNKDADNFVSKHYLERFTERECEFLDNFYANVASLDASENVKNLALANMLLYIMDRCFVGGRLNKGQVLAQLDHRINHNRNKGYEMLFKDIRWHNFNCAENEQKHFAYNMDAIDLLGCTDRTQMDLVYIDPPYGGQQSNYGNMFDFFESYVRQETKEQWGADLNLNRFITKKDYAEHFDKLMAFASHSPTIVISYNDSSWSDIDTVRQIVLKYKTDVKVKEIEYDYKYRNKSNKKGIEYIIIAR